MKILATGCMHGDSRLAQELATRAKKEGVELVLICGDITRGNESTEGMIGPFKKLGLEVGLVPGNHEPEAVTQFLSEAYKIKNLHGSSFKLDGTGFFGCGAANIGMHQIGDEESYFLFYKGFKDIKTLNKKIMISHIPPSGTLMEKLVPGSGSDAVRRAIESFKPDIAICSHLHEAEGIEETLGNTRILNVGRKGKIFEI